jgi:hypothetical protein
LAHEGFGTIQSCAWHTSIRRPPLAQSDSVSILFDKNYVAQPMAAYIEFSLDTELSGLARYQPT